MSSSCLAIYWVIARGNVSVFQKTRDTRETKVLLWYTLEHDWLFIEFKSCKNCCHDALKRVKVWGIYSLNVTVNYSKLLSIGFSI